MSNRTAAAIAGLIGALSLPVVQAQIVHHDTRITVTVVGEDQEPVSDALVQIAFGQQRQLGKAIQIEGLSDSRGIFSAQHMSDGHVFWSAQKAGYYSSTGYDHLFNSDLVKAGRWEPWDIPFTSVLRKIINPIAVYRKEINGAVPEVGKSVGFDLLVGDWVAPYGRGTVSDFIFLAQYDKRGPRDYDFVLRVSFSNHGDGIQEVVANREWENSEFIWPYIAPIDGYSNGWVQIRYRTPGTPEEGNHDPDRKYVFRVRSVVDDDGKPVRAIYGRISGDFMHFTYCLNPLENDRNLEYSGQNLFEEDERPFPP